jgi:hypothetical protein
MEVEVEVGQTFVLLWRTLLQNVGDTDAGCIWMLQIVITSPLLDHGSVHFISLLLSFHLRLVFHFMDGISSTRGPITGYLSRKGEGLIKMFSEGSGKSGKIVNTGMPSPGR